MHEFDIAVIGSGPGGYRAAVLAALRGRKVAIIEKGDWGGCCLNRGCVPKKDWHHAATLLARSRGFAARGLRGTLQGDLDAAWEHQEQVVDTVQRSYLDYLARLGVTTVKGSARFEDEHTLHITGASPPRLRARHIIIASGSRPVTPSGLSPIAGKILTTDMLFDERPPAGARVAVVGGGVIATEFAFILKMLGKEVSWLSRGAPLAGSRFSRPAVSVLNDALRAAGIGARTGASIVGVRVDDGGVGLTLDDGSVERVDWVLLGTGRVAYTDGLGLDAAGVALDEQGRIVTNAHLQTAVAHIYAIGDCIAGAPLTANQALADASLAVHNIVDGSDRRRDPRRVPEAIYSAVELARVGMNEEEAEEAGLEPAIGFSAFAASPKALGEGDAEGFARLVADMDSGALLGGEIVGAEAGELIHLLALAPDGETALHWLAEGNFNHPARAEELLNATETLASKWHLADQVFKPRVKPTD